MELIKKADVLVLPSIIEGLPGVILEAFYCRTHVVAYNVGGIHEILINNHTGYLVEKNDEDAFVKAIEAASAGGNHRLTENAYKLVTSEYLNKRIAGKFAEAYQRLLSN
jgi:glycosyltransferase involved in cell wall biosynthesis